jgi:hypothetical protein
MTPEERATRVAIDLVADMQEVGAMRANVLIVASAIRAAEDDALERAAVAVEGALRFHSYAGTLAALAIRSLKSRSPSSTEGP